MAPPYVSLYSLCTLSRLLRFLTIIMTFSLCEQCLLTLFLLRVSARPSRLRPPPSGCAPAACQHPPLKLPRSHPSAHSYGRGSCCRCPGVYLGYVWVTASTAGAVLSMGMLTELTSLPSLLSRAWVVAASRSGQPARRGRSSARRDQDEGGEVSRYVRPCLYWRPEPPREGRDERARGGGPDRPPGPARLPRPPWRLAVPYSHTLTDPLYPSLSRLPSSLFIRADPPPAQSNVLHPQARPHRPSSLDPLPQRSRHPPKDCL